MRTRLWTPAKKAEVIRMYEAGASVLELAVRCGRTRQAIRTLLSRAGAKRRDVRPRGRKMRAGAFGLWGGVIDGDWDAS